MLPTNEVFFLLQKKALIIINKKILYVTKYIVISSSVVNICMWQQNFVSYHNEWGEEGNDQDSVWTQIESNVPEKN